MTTVATVGVMTLLVVACVWVTWLNLSKRGRT